MAKKIRLDFSKVEERSGWNTKVMPEGIHAMKIVAVEDKDANDGTAMLTYALVPVDGKYKTRRFPYYCKLQPNQYFKIRDLFVAAGISVPKKVMNLDPDAPIGKIIAAEVVDSRNVQYQGRSEIDGVYDRSIIDEDDAPVGDDEDDEEYEGDEEEDAGEDEVEEEEEDDEEEDEDLSALSLPELRKRAKGLGIDTNGVKKDELIELILEEEEGSDDEDDEDEDDLGDEDLEDEDLEDEEFEDDEEEEEEPAPKKRAAPVRKAAPAKVAPAKRTVKRR